MCVFLVVLHFCYLLAVVFVIHIWPIYCFNGWYLLFKQKYAHHFSTSFFRLCCGPNATSSQLHPTISSWPLLLHAIIWGSGDCNRQHTHWTRTRAVPSVSAAWGLYLKGRSWLQDHSWLHRMYLKDFFMGLHDCVAKHMDSMPYWKGTLTLDEASSTPGLPDIDVNVLWHRCSSSCWLWCALGLGCQTT